MSANPMKKQLLAALCAVVMFSPQAMSQDASPKPPRRNVDLILTDLNASDLDAIEEPASVAILQLIDFPGNDGTIDDKSFELLHRFPGLKTLMLSCPRITDKGFAQVAKLKNLECVIVYECHLTDNGLQELKPLSKLKIVGLHGTSVTDEGITKLKETLKETYCERGSFGKNGSVFDANGCIRPSFLKEHLNVQKLKAK